MFREPVIAQMAAFFLQKERGQMPILKLMKLLYLSEREALDLYGHPISFDRMVSMKSGPVLSRTLDYVNGSIESEADGWETWIAARAGNEVALAKSPTREALTELSDADLQVLESVWARFGHMNKWEIRDYTHDKCAEWQDPQGGTLPIFYKDVFVALGKADQADELTEDLRTLYREERIFERL
jgi:uncharacterized phage-associated protein